jgi:antitoxin (DNA-binding transcriptional repressor) of toxin-antitoxin stability system
MYKAMKRYTVGQARERLAELLDAAESGRPVVVERRGVRFVVQRQPAPRRRARRRTPLLEYVDPALAAGEWTWTWSARGLRFSRRRSSR